MIFVDSVWFCRADKQILQVGNAMNIDIDSTELSLFILRLYNSNICGATVVATLCNIVTKIIINLCKIQDHNHIQEYYYLFIVCALYIESYQIIIHIWGPCKGKTI